MDCTCKQCGKTFEITESEIAFYEGKGLSLPKRCSDCRKKNRKAKKAKYRQYKAAQKNTSQRNDYNDTKKSVENNGKNDGRKQTVKQSGIVDTASAKAESYLARQKAAKAEKGKRWLWIICAVAVLAVAFLIYTAVK